MRVQVVRSGVLTYLRELDDWWTNWTIGGQIGRLVDELDDWWTSWTSGGRRGTGGGTLLDEGGDDVGRGGGRRWTNGASVLPSGKLENFFPDGR